MTFDLDLWPTDLTINRDHLLIKDYLPTKFEASGAKRSWVISCTRLRATDIPTDRQTDRHTDRHTDIPTDMCKAICPSFFKGGHKHSTGQVIYRRSMLEVTTFTKPFTTIPYKYKHSTGQVVPPLDVRGHNVHKTVHHHTLQIQT